VFPRVSEVKTKGKVYRYFRLVEKYRNQKGRKSQRAVCNFGRLEELQKGRLDELTEKLRRFCKKTVATSPARKTNPTQSERRYRRGQIHRSR
jgi:hypothetical protein